MEPVTLTTGRLVPRPVGPADTQPVYEAAQDPDIHAVSAGARGREVSASERQ
jgi:hypothetical protein